MDDSPPVLRLPMELIELIVFELTGERLLNLAALKGSRLFRCDGACDDNAACQLGAQERRKKLPDGHGHIAIQELEPAITTANQHVHDIEYHYDDSTLWNSWVLDFSSTHSQLRHMIFDGMVVQTLGLKAMKEQELKEAISLFGGKQVRYALCFFPGHVVRSPHMFVSSERCV
jgi:hypothetical protein